MVHIQITQWTQFVLSGTAHNDDYMTPLLEHGDARTALSPCTFLSSDKLFLSWTEHSDTRTCSKGGHCSQHVCGARHHHMPVGVPTVAGMVYGYITLSHVVQPQAYA